MLRDMPKLEKFGAKIDATAHIHETLKLMILKLMMLKLMML